jgi:hypothetical protein
MYIQNSYHETSRQILFSHFVLFRTQYNLMSEYDLSLPDTVSGMARYHDRPMTIAPFALYDPINLSNGAVEVVEECNSMCPGDDYVHFQKTSNITSLKSLIDFHLNSTVPQGFDPCWFLVISDQDWRNNGILVITLSGDEGRPDMFYIETADSGLVLVNLQIANTDWFEAKEGYDHANHDNDERDTHPGTV